MVARQLPQLAREAAGAVSKNDLSLAIAARVEQNVADRRMARVILEADRHAVVLQLEVAERHPAAFAAPAHVDELLAVGQQLEERGHGMRRVGMGFGSEDVAAGGDSKSGHRKVSGLTGEWNGRPDAGWARAV